MAQVTKIESINHTPEQVREILREARAAVDEMGPPDDLRVAVFEQACQLLGQKYVSFVVEQPVPFVPPTLNHKARR